MIAGSGKGVDAMRRQGLRSVSDHVIPEDSVQGTARPRGERRLRPIASSAVRVDAAHTRAELEAAYRLVHSRYASYGLEKLANSEARFIPQCCMASTRTFVACIGETVIATVSLVVDDALGLPMDEVYGRELADLRERGGTIAEASCLATRRRGDFAVLMGLYRALYAEARYRAGVTELCITVHPSQRAFYERVLLFRPLGPVRAYQACNGAPGVALRLDLASAEKRYRRAHGSGLVSRFFLERIDYSVLAGSLRSPTTRQRMERYAYARSRPEWRRLGDHVRRSIDASYRN
jgi:hypothetical protein